MDMALIILMSMFVLCVAGEDTVSFNITMNDDVQRVAVKQCPAIVECMTAMWEPTYGVCLLLWVLTVPTKPHIYPIGMCVDLNTKRLCITYVEDRSYFRSQRRQQAGILLDTEDIHFHIGAHVHIKVAIPEVHIEFGNRPSVFRRLINRLPRRTIDRAYTPYFIYPAFLSQLACSLQLRNHHPPVYDLPPSYDSDLPPLDYRNQILPVHSDKPPLDEYDPPPPYDDEDFSDEDDLFGTPPEVFGRSPVRIAGPSGEYLTQTAYFASSEYASQPSYDSDDDSFDTASALQTLSDSHSLSQCDSDDTGIETSVDLFDDFPIDYYLDAQRNRRGSRDSHSSQYEDLPYDHASQSSEDLPYDDAMQSFDTTNQQDCDDEESDGALEGAVGYAPIQPYEQC